MHAGRAVGGQAGQHQGGAGPQVRGGHGRAAEAIDAANHRRAAAAGDLGAQAVQFGHVLKTPRENAVAHRAAPARPATSGPSTGLADRWGCRDRARPTTSTGRGGPSAAQRHAIAAGLDRRAGGGQPCQHGVQMGRVDSRSPQRPARDGRGQEQRGGLDAVGDHAIASRRPVADALDFDGSRFPAPRSAPPGR